MTVLLIRHAEAADGEDDAIRPLTPKGWRQTRDVLRGLRRLGLHVDRLHFSPKRRAVETAEGLAKLADALVVTPGLARAPDRALVTELAGDRVGVVGHQPDLGKLVDLLVGGKVGGGIDWKKSGVVWLEGEPGALEIYAVLPPRVLRRLG